MASVGALVPLCCRALATHYFIFLDLKILLGTLKLAYLNVRMFKIPVDNLCNGNSITACFGVWRQCGAVGRRRGGPQAGQDGGDHQVEDPGDDQPRRRRQLAGGLGLDRPPVGAERAAVTGHAGRS